MKKWILGILTFLKLSLLIQAQNITSVTPLSTTVGRYDKFEAVVALNATFSNPYDYDQVVLKGVFTAPSGKKDSIEGFYLQDFTLNTTSGNLTTKGAGEWRIRFAPTETGEWQYTITVQTLTSISAASTGAFTCNSSTAKGFVRKNNSNYLSFDNGDSYIPVGQNLCWHSGNPYLTYKNWLEKMGAAKANFMRLWLCHWGLSLEWKNDVNSGYQGLKKYKQNNAWYLDWLVEKCQEQGIYMMFCINHHGQVSTQVNPNWSDNPYNVANGGMCGQTWHFFNNEDAKKSHKNRLRYIVARWGYSRHIMTWELFNEVNWTDSYNSNSIKTDVRTWHDEMAQYLKQIDPHKHLVSTSYAKDEDSELWKLPSMDYTQTHAYLSVPNIEKAIADDGYKFVKDYNKPSFNGEFGIDVGSGSGTSSSDPKGIHLHNTLWATAFSGAMGAGATWWWDSYTDPRNLYGEFTPLSNFIQNLSLNKDNYKPTTATISGGNGSGNDVTASPSGDWGQTTDAAFTVTSSGVSAGRLGQYLYGSEWNTQLRNPPTFTVIYPKAGQFKVKTAANTGQTPRISIYLNGNLALDTPALVNKIYTIDIPAGSHSIKVDNLGTDWIRIAEYTFTGIGGAPINTYILKSEKKDKATGWLHNRRYNWQDIKTAVPPSVSNANFTISDMQAGSYDIKFYSCANNALLSTSTLNTVGSSLSILIPDLAWDVAFTATRTGLVNTDDIASKNISLKIYPNPVRLGSELSLDTEGVTSGEYLLRIISMSGQILKAETIRIDNTIPYSIHIEGMKSGLYILNLTNGTQAISTRIKIID